ncbi:hypothetical protein JOD64_000358 [Micromonospora luteifusca]|uniref:Uncharacterized protein n=1 Tax=Micromonospora luteifusca TaxID=709860 RepID=A0ABS2LLS7_9ACTN|nr:hypothetical protein [Micromonospora luteifusca]
MQQLERGNRLFLFVMRDAWLQPDAGPGLVSD